MGAAKERVRGLLNHIMCHKKGLRLIILQIIRRDAFVFLQHSRCTPVGRNAVFLPLQRAVVPVLRVQITIIAQRSGEGMPYMVVHGEHHFPV